uniref:Secreted protein n=1 Tax=Glossina palpalis gambiensis TaxID=67801 RepID=A0A1B0AWB4_9MUSC
MFSSLVTLTFLCQLFTNLSHCHSEWLTYIKTCMVLILHRYPVRRVSFVFECLVTLVAFGRSAAGVVVDIDIEAASDGGNGC